MERTKLQESARIIESEAWNDCRQLIVNDMRRAMINEDLDPLGSTEMELGIALAIDILATEIQQGTIGKYQIA